MPNSLTAQEIAELTAATSPSEWVWTVRSPFGVRRRKRKEFEKDEAWRLRWMKLQFSPTLWFETEKEARAYAVKSAEEAVVAAEREWKAAKRKLALEQKRLEGCAGESVG